jgi:pyrimidine-nucleoside phosphorylase
MVRELNSAMIPAAVISKKRDGQALTQDEICKFIVGYCQGTVPDYQMSALAMAIFFQSMTAEETGFLTQAMLESGERLRRVSAEVPRVGKHSTGGLGDKTSLILAPLMACFPVHVPKLSGRGLGITGGTLDKLESIPGYRTNLTQAEIEKQLLQVGCVITGATGNIVPADKKLYALRDVTGTVPSIPLIASSIMSKKLAETLDALVLDVKFGTGAFMATRSQGAELARCMVDTGTSVDVPTDAILSDMNQPLGSAVGNACEVNEAIDVLRGNGPRDVVDLVVQLSSRLLVMSKLFTNETLAVEQLQLKLRDGSAYERFEKMVALQGGRLPTNYLPTAGPIPLIAPWSGKIVSIDGQKLGWGVIQLGGGRRLASDSIDSQVGLLMRVRIGDQVQRGQELLHILADHAAANSVKSLLLSAFEFDSQ